jgi:hypothetical protein
VAKRVRVKLFGHQNRSVVVDSHATEGAIVDKNLRWSDGSLVAEDELKNPPGGGTVELPEVMPTLWSLILNIPQIIKDLVAMVGPGYVYHNGTTVVSHEWPLHDVRIEVNEQLIIPNDKQYILWQHIEIEGSMVVEAGGKLVILDEGLPEPTDPDFTFVTGDLTQVDYDGGEQKFLTYNVGGDLERVDFIQDGVTLRKDLFYSGGDLDYIDEYYL